MIRPKYRSNILISEDNVVSSDIIPISSYDKFREETYIYISFINDFMGLKSFQRARGVNKFIKTSDQLTLL